MQIVWTAVESARDYRRQSIRRLPAYVEQLDRPDESAERRIDVDASAVADALGRDRIEVGAMDRDGHVDRRVRGARLD